LTEGRQFIQVLRNTYKHGFREYLGYIREAEEHHADPHEKKALRVAAWKEAEETGEFCSKMYVKRLEFKFKRREWAKPGKIPRVYVNLGELSSLQGFRLMEYMKNVQYHEPINWKGGTIYFVKTPKRTMLKRIFDLLIDPPGRYVAVAFSDDCCLSIRTHEGLRMYNLDISACDVSHTPSIFTSFVSLFPPHVQQEAQALIDQTLRRGILYSQDKTARVVLKANEYFLASGSVLTTSLNTYATMLFLSNIVSQEKITMVSVEMAAEEVGYIITVEHCEIPEDLQFLKNSPVKDVHDEYQPVLNFGVLVRAGGTCQGDLPGSGSLEWRAGAFQKALVQGMYPYIDTPVINTMKDKVKDFTVTQRLRELVHRDIEWKHIDDEKVIHKFHSHDLFRRYRLNGMEIDVMENDYATLGYGQFMAHSSLDRILHKDYGLKSLHP